MELEVRPLAREELALAASLERECFSAPWSEGMMQDAYAEGTVFLGAFADGAFAGHISMQTVLDEGYIANLAVSPKLRRRGIGMAILDAAKKEAADRGVAVLMLEVRASNEAAQALYLRSGFEKVGMRRNFYSLPREDGILYNFDMQACRHAAHS